ncbi:MAG: DMT family transporter [Acuticoccus sp.]
MAPPAVVAALCIAGAAFLYSINTALIRLLSEELNAFMIGALRNMFALLFFAPLLLRSGPSTFRTERWNVHLLRSGCAIASGLLMFWALGVVPLSDAVALFFVAPIFVAVAAVFLFGETMGVRRWTATGFGFLGVLIILRPGFQEISFGLLGILGSALLWSGMALCNKSLTRTETMTQIVVLNLIVAGPVSLLIALPYWQTPTLWALSLTAVQGFLGTIAHFLVARGFKLSDASHIMPFDFLRLPFTALLAFVLFAEWPDIYVWIGAAVIFASTSYMAWRARHVSGGDVILPRVADDGASAPPHGADDKPR